MTTRQEVYAALDSERAYQRVRWDLPDEQRQHEIDAWVAYIVAYTDRLLQAAAAWKTPEEKIEVLNFVRKVGALCVVAMEQHGAPRREGF